MKSPYPLLNKSFLTLSFRILDLRLFQKGFTSKNVLSLILTNAIYCITRINSIRF